MPLGDLWNRTLVYFGIAEEDDDWDEESFEEEERVAATRQPERPNVRRLTPRARPVADDWSDSDQATAIRPARPARDVRPARDARPRQRPRAVVEAVPSSGSGAVKVHLVLPRSFNDAQQIADRFKQSIPVILNL